ncbi:non-ribosomal peptide synthetase [Nonomuraea sediminis]|uniref:non-ribosomal peptide synthetase n=1 Tax=Nonomuraea sediminis TaxID=2835864 RepID=UPI001BDC9751|nr:amino acid adenylation domain-containing protein [Nonomuraea sediminis]
MTGNPTGFAGRAIGFGPFRPVSAMIEEQTDRSPERPAVTYDGRTLTYRQLDDLVNGLAATLAGHGVGKGDVVAALLVNSLELPVTYLALMKLGAAFVPLDPSWPRERIRDTLEVLPDGPILCAADDALPPDSRHRAVTVDLDGIVPTGRRPAVDLGPGDPVYGYFTSGTTGTPKCAMNLHGGLTNRFRFMTRYFAATGDDVVLQNSRHTSDSAIWQLFWPLTTGGRTVLPVQGEFLNLRHTIDLIAQYGITTADFVSSVFNALVAVVDGDETALGGLSTLRRLIVGSEAVNPPAVHRLMSLLPGLSVTNGYGPTEASIGMVFHRVSAADGDTIPLGRPIDNCYAVVVDDDLRPLPPGATGEIAIGGACLGAGYLGDPAATAKAFVRNPFPQRIPGDRLYLTGDLGHLDGAGLLFFSGRKDFQVKIHGVRIELGEIAAAAQRCPGVRQAEVLVGEQAGTKALALFASGNGLTESALGAELRRTLPRTSLPRYFFLLPEMPLHDNGKVDRGRLQEILDGRLAEDTALLAESVPTTSLADQVLRAMRSALGWPGLTASTHFAESGGDSIQALSAVHMITAETGVRVDVKDLYDHPTADDLTFLIERRRRDGAAIEEESVLMARDSALPEGEPIRPAPRPERLRTVLVTGATGFVGSRLVHELLDRTDLRVACLARAAGDQAATERVVAALTERGLWERRFADRLDGYAGDLALPGLGLDTRTWEHLARTCDLVLHNGAMVNFLFDYRAHRQVNVRGTIELVRLAMAYRPVPVHYVSTLAAIQEEALHRGERLAEDCDPSLARTPAGGYSRSKWVAERYLAEARNRGALVTVLRLGEIMPSADNGYPNPVAFTHLLLSAFLRLGVRPDVATRSDYTPVDYVASRVAAAVSDTGVWGRTLHVFRSESVSLDDVLARAGVPIAPIPCGDFVSLVRETGRATGDRELTTLASLLPAVQDEGELRRAFGSLLTDNPALFRKDECHRLEQRWRLDEGTLDGPIAAYHARLASRNGNGLALTTGQRG